MPLPAIHLKSGKDRPVRFGHPWIYSGAIRDLDPRLEGGSLVRVHAADGELLGIGYANPRCPITVRMLTRADEAVDAAFIRTRVEAAASVRRALVDARTTAYRLVNGEGDGLPGIVVDHYDGVLVLQVFTAGAERLRSFVLEALAAVASPRGVYERSEGSVRRAEGLEARSGLVSGEVPDELSVAESSLRFLVSPRAGQKTGFFLDQRDNRVLVRRLAADRRVLDAFAYTGGFATAAGAGGARHVAAVERSAEALSVAARNWGANNLPVDRATFVQAEVQRYLRETNEQFDVVVLDPPALVKQRADVERGARAYKDLHLWALRRAVPGADLLTFTCSPHVGAELFRKIVLGAAADAGRTLQLLQHLGPGIDHPVALGHPEGEYFHGLLLRVR